MSFGVLREKYTENLTTATTRVVQVSVVNAERIGIEVNVTGNPLATFTVKASFHSPDRYNTLFETAGDYLNPICPLIGASGDLTTLSGEGWLMLDTRGMGHIVIEMSSSSTSTVSVNIGG